MSEKKMSGLQNDEEEKEINGTGAAEDTVGVPYGGTRTQLLRSGGSLEIVPHAGGFLASILDLDPATGATGPADLGTTHGYTSERLTQLEEEARGILSDPDSTQDLDAAAREVLAAVAAIRETQGSFDRESGTVNFTAPHNYTGGSLYYRVTVSDAGTGDALFLVDIAVKAEENPLTAALSRLEAAKNNALIAKQTEALQEASQNTGGYGGYEGGESGGET